MSKGINANVEANEGGGAPLTREMLDEAMRMLPRYQPPLPICLGPKEFKMMEEGRHPAYPPSDSTLIAAWREFSRRWWASALEKGKERL